MPNDTDDDLESFELTLDLEHEVTIVRVIENSILPSHFKIKAQAAPSEEAEDEDIQIAVQKIRFWMDNIASSAIAFDRSNEIALNMLLDEQGRKRVANNLMLCPGEPTEVLMAALFQSKMSALAEGFITFGAVEVRSSDATGLVLTYLGEAREDLPDMDGWIGERTYFDEPWWCRDDASSIDTTPPEGANLSDKPSWAFSLDFISDAAKANDDVVIRGEFKPVVIDGGKSD